MVKCLTHMEDCCNPMHDAAPLDRVQYDMSPAAYMLIQIAIAGQW